MDAHARARTLALIRHLRRFKLAKRRRKQPKPLQPNAIRLWYYQEISKYLDAAVRAVTEDLLPELRDVARTDVRMDAGDGKRLNAAMDRITKRFWNQTFHPRDVEALATTAASRTSDFQKEQFFRQARAGLGVDPYLAEPHLHALTANFVAENVALIKSVPAQYFTDIEKTVTAGVRQGIRHEEIAKQLTERHGVAANRAKIIARDQVGKFYGSLAKERQEALGVIGYTWRTSNDNRVREEHEERAGVAFTWADPPEDGPPGEAINCRCWAEPDFGDLLTPDAEQGADEGASSTGSDDEPADEDVSADEEELETSEESNPDEEPVDEETFTTENEESTLTDETFTTENGEAEQPFDWTAYDREVAEAQAAGTSPTDLEPTPEAAKERLPTKAEAIEEFIARNRDLFEQHDVENKRSRGARQDPREFDAINEKYGLKGKNRVTNIRQAISKVIGPYVKGEGFDLANMDLEALNELNLARETPFELPDSALNRQLMRRQIEEYAKQSGGYDY